MFLCPSTTLRARGAVPRWGSTPAPVLLHTTWRMGAGPPAASCGGSAWMLGDLWSVFEPGIIKLS